MRRLIAQLLTVMALSALWAVSVHASPCTNADECWNAAVNYCDDGDHWVEGGTPITTAEGEHICRMCCTGFGTIPWCVDMTCRDSFPLLERAAQTMKQVGADRGVFVFDDDGSFAGIYEPAVPFLQDRLRAVGGTSFMWSSNSIPLMCPADEDDCRQHLAPMCDGVYGGFDGCADEPDANGNPPVVRWVDDDGTVNCACQCQNGPGQAISACQPRSICDDPDVVGISSDGLREFGQ